MSRDRTYFIVRKLHSLTGLVPVGVFLCAHLFINSGALLGECEFTEGVRGVNSLPYLPYIEFGGILLPLLFHGIIGLYIVIVQAKYNNFAYNYSRNWWYTIQRFTGVLTFAFIAWHLWDMFIAKLLGQMHLNEFYGHLDSNMSGDRLYLALYIVGTLVSTFHFSNGLWGFFASWGLFQSRRAQRVASWGFTAVGVVLFVAWINIIFHFATGGTNVVPVQEPPRDCVTTQLAAGER